VSAGNVGKRMSKNLNEILATADWKELTPHLLHYGDKLIRRCIWRGLAVTAQPGGRVCVEGCGADDFLQEAIDRFLNRRRTYNYSASLEQNLRGAIKSIIWSLNKSSQRRPLIDMHAMSDAGEKSDPIAQLPSSTPPADASIMADERAQEQKRILEEFENTLTSESDLLKVLNGYKAGYVKPQEIEKFTGISAARASELKRKLRERMEHFETQAARHQNRTI
jgi:ERCC4-type nuclease